MSVGNNIRKIRIKNGLTQEELGKIADVSSMAVSQWENDRAVPRMGAVQRMADYFGISKSQIIDDDAIIDTPLNAFTPNPSPRPAYAPLLGRVHAGNAQEPEVIDSSIPLPYEVKKNHEYAYFLEVEGDCMDKVYPEGCYILVDPHKEPINGSIAVVSIDGADYVMRRLYRGANTLILSPDSHSQEHEDIVLTSLDEHTVEYVGTVVWFQPKEEME